MARKTDLYVLRQGCLAGRPMHYGYRTLNVHMRPYAGAIGDNSFLMGDNALEHRVRVIDDYLQQETMERMDQLARALDLNPIAIAGT